MWTLGDRLRIARESVTSSQGKFAEMTGISRNTVGRYEADQVRRVKAYVVRTWADVTGYSYDWLLTGNTGDTRDETDTGSVTLRYHGSTCPPTPSPQVSGHDHPRAA